MEKIINIGGKDVKFKASAGTLYRYRMYFKSDMIKDFIHLKNKVSNKELNSEEQLEVVDLELFERIAWVLAKTGDDNIKPIEQWLDDFDSFSIYQILPQLSDMIIENFRGANQEKKNIIPQEIANQN